MDDKFARGLKKLEEIDGQAGLDIVERLGDLGKYIVEFAFADIYSREGLTMRDREIATIAALTVMGGREPQLELHLKGGLRVGLTKEEIEEILIQTVPYAGFPSAINALVLLNKIK